MGHLVEVASKKSVISFIGNFLWQPPIRKEIASAISKNEKMLVAEKHGYENAKLVIQLALWDIETRKIVKTFPGMPSSLLSVSFSDDNKEIIGKGTNGKTMSWNVATGKMVK